MVYQEVFGPHPDQAQESLAQLQANGHGAARVRVGPASPRRLAARAIHGERAALPRGGGLCPLGWSADSCASGRIAGGDAASPGGRGLLCRRLGAEGDPVAGPPGPFAGGLARPARRAGPRTLCIHVVQVDADDIARLAGAGVGVAHCPLSNRRHGHGDAPLAGLLSAGLRVGVGTDSVASVGCLDLLAEARAARSAGGALVGRCARARHPRRRSGARARGEVGSLAVGKWGDTVVIRLRGGESPVEQVMNSGTEAVVATYVGGRPVFEGAAA